jgi:hypothetical protein
MAGCRSRRREAITGRGEEEGGKELVFGPAVSDGLLLYRKIYVPTGQDPFARFLDILVNPSASERDAKLTLRTDLGSNASTVLVGTSSGDATFDESDDFLITDDAVDGGGSPAIVQRSRARAHRSRRWRSRPPRPEATRSPTPTACGSLPAGARS